jgi:flagellar basal-body rod protein FlgF
MDRLGYTAMTAANRSMQALQIHANNLANVNTAGFRADMERAAAVEVEGYGYDSRHMARVENNGVDLTPGPVNFTGRALDVAIKGQGLLTVQNGAGAEAYTRNGSLQVDAEGQLTVGGRVLLGEDGPLVLPEYDQLHIGTDGTVSVVPRGDFLMVEVGRIRLVDSQGADLMKNAQGLLIPRDNQPLAANEDITLASGYLESSNVSSIDQLVSTMSLSRLFETQVKMMKAAENLSEAGNRLIRG